MAENLRKFIAIEHRSEDTKNMRKAIFEISAAVGAAAIVLIVVAVSGSLSGVLRWLLVGATAVAACGLAWWAARRLSQTANPSGLQIANRIRSSGKVNIEDVSLDPTARDAQVANDIRSKRDTSIKRIGTQNKRPSK
ncbi:hypothetical protein AB0M20_10480 [Actinoplanes sp. NPDC051633]|uniref:hypothetical protein n=1 Tax=Actinoplanes sp. NPDC051633 TaxID=3155670 RepID=UPI0034372876